MKIILTPTAPITIDLSKNVNSDLAKLLLDTYNEQAADNEEDTIDDLKDADHGTLHDIIRDLMGEDMTLVVDLNGELSENDFEIKVEA